MLAKRLFDIVISMLGLLVLAPLLVVIGIVIKLTSRGPILYHAYRVGRYGVIFELYKFRTMVQGADQIGPAITHANDPRITYIGKILRRTKLDELPQLLNVFKGDMSIVGPRPEDPVYVRHYTPEQRKLLEVRPGITSLASIEYRDEEQILKAGNWEEIYLYKILPDKLAIDMEYVTKGATITWDILIILKTLSRVAFGGKKTML